MVRMGQGQSPNLMIHMRLQAYISVERPSTFALNSDPSTSNYRLIESSFTLTFYDLAKCPNGRSNFRYPVATYAGPPLCR